MHFVILHAGKVYPSFKTTVNDGQTVGGLTVYCVCISPSYCRRWLACLKLYILSKIQWVILNGQTVRAYLHGRRVDCLLCMRSPHITLQAGIVYPSFKTTVILDDTIPNGQKIGELTVQMHHKCMLAQFIHHINIIQNHSG